MKNIKCASCLVSILLFGPMALSQQGPSTCNIQKTSFDGFDAEEMSNNWVRLTIIPQLGGRLMQVAFDGHPYLFVNPVYRGKFIPSAQAAGDWINYGGDKIWPLPEGNDDEQHWSGASTPLDDSPYAFSVVSQNETCTVRLEGPPDPPTGLQYTREISIGSDSPEISFHAITRNYTGHSIEWSVQSVSQYNLSDATDSKQFNKDFWAFAPLNPHTSYLLGYHVRDGLANDPSFKSKGGLFRLHWKYIESEVWLDSSSGWIALVDGATRYAMVEKTRYFTGAEYPSKASVIFYKNGPTVEMDSEGRARLSSGSLEKTPYYLEAELNSPMETLGPGETSTFDTKWFPSRMTHDFTSVTDAGIIGRPLKAKEEAGKLELSGMFGVFFSGQLRAIFYGQDGAQNGESVLQSIRPQELVDLHKTIDSAGKIKRVSVHVIDQQGTDRGALGEVFVNGDEVGR